MKGAVLAALWLALHTQGRALDTLRLPWIFSDEPALAADFNFSPGRNGETQVQICLGGFFKDFGLPKGAARAPQLEVLIEFLAPGALRPLRSTHSSLDLIEALKEYQKPFSRSIFKASSDLVYKNDQRVSLPPGDYNVTVDLRDEELSIQSRRTLHVIVPDLASGASGLGDLKFCLGLGERLDAQGRVKRWIDPNPWRQVSFKRGWDLIVAYDFAPAMNGSWRREVRVRRLRGNDEAVLSRQDALPLKNPGQYWITQIPTEEFKVWMEGVYVLEIDLWPRKNRAALVSSSKTFEVLP